MSTRMYFAQTLLFRIIIAIILSIIYNFFFPKWLARISVTLNGLFGNFLGFFIPVLIFALITPAIASLGRGAGRWLGITTAIVYGLTVFSGLSTYATTQELYPRLLGADQTGAPVNIDEGALESFFNVEVPPSFDVMTVLLLAFTADVAMTTVKSDSLYRGATQLRDMTMKIISALIILLLPIYILDMLLSMDMNGNLITTLSMFFRVLVLAAIGTVLPLAIQFSITDAIAGRNPWTPLKNTPPAYVTILGTSPSAATIPVTCKAALKDGVSEKIVGFTVPLCMTIRLAGSMMKITLFTFTVMSTTDKLLSPGTAIGFILTLGITMIAAPGVPGGIIMTAVGMLQPTLDSDQEQIALMVVACITIDSFGTACNVIGDGAIAMVVNRFAKDDVIDHSEELNFDVKEANSAPSATEAQQISVHV